MATATAASVPAVYARACYELAIEQGVAPSVVEDCNSLAQALRAAPELIERVEQPSLSKQAAKDMLRQIFGQQVHAITLDMLCLLVDKARFAAVIDICEALVLHADKAAGVVAVDVCTAVPLGVEAGKKLSATMSRLYGDGVVLHTRVDDSLLGGLTVQVGDTFFDASSRRKLDDIHKQLSEAPLGGADAAAS